MFKNLLTVLLEQIFEGLYLKYNSKYTIRIKEKFWHLKSVKITLLEFATTVFPALLERYNNQKLVAKYVSNISSCRGEGNENEAIKAIIEQTYNSLKNKTMLKMSLTEVKRLLGEPAKGIQIPPWKTRIAYFVTRVKDIKAPDISWKIPKVNWKINMTWYYQLKASIRDWWKTLHKKSAQKVETVMQSAQTVVESAYPITTKIVGTIVCKNPEQEQYYTKIVRHILAEHPNVVCLS